MNLQLTLKRGAMSDATTSTNPNSRTAGLISALILVCLGIQAVISIVLPPIGPFKATWPFVNYGMYRPAHREGDLIPKRVVVGVRKDGSQVMITPGDLGWNNWFYELFADALLNHDQTVVNSFLSQGPGTRNTQWSSLRLIDQSMAFRWTGPVQVPEKELAIMRVEPLQEKGQ
jgi:hypothetical protein